MKKKASILKYIFILIVLVAAGTAAWLFVFPKSTTFQRLSSAITTGTTQAQTVNMTSLPASKELENGYYVAQTFNNCGPSALSMDFSFYGINVSQEALADDLRPTHNLTGKGDDKSTTPEEIVGEINKYGLTAYYRPDGSIQELKEFIANGIPVITRTLFMPDEDFGHYRVIKGYDDTTGQIIDEDGFSGPEVHFSYADFSSLWQEYNYEYIVIVPPGKDALVQSIIGGDMNTTTAWQNALTRAQSELAANTSSAADIRTQFNISVAEYYLGNYQASITAFEKVEPTLPTNILWYQMEPIESYYEVGNYPEVFTLANSILGNGDAVYPELITLEGQAYEKQGNTAQAKADFEQALVYNKNLVVAQQALASL